MAQKEMTTLTTAYLQQLVFFAGEATCHPDTNYLLEFERLASPGIVLELAQQVLDLRQKEQHESNTCRLNFEQWLEQQRGKIDVDCGCVSTETFMHWLRVAYEAGNYPDIPDSCQRQERASPVNVSALSRMFIANWLTVSTIQRSSVLAPSNYEKELAEFWATLLRQIIINKPRKVAWKGVTLRRH